MSAFSNLEWRAGYKEMKKKEKIEIRLIKEFVTELGNAIKLVNPLNKLILCDCKEYLRLFWWHPR